MVALRRDLLPLPQQTQRASRYLPKHVCDNRQGIWIARDRYQDQDDAVIGAYARATHVGGHSHNDAGSIRLLALNHDWIIGGGQARGKAEWQSCVTDADAEMRKKSQNRGLIIWDEYDDSGARMAMDLRWNTLCYNERYVGVRWATDEQPLMLAQLDLIEHAPGRSWWWSQVFADELACEINSKGYELMATDGARMNVQFIGHQPDEITLERLPPSKRTYASGGQVEYPGRPYIRAVFSGNRELQHIYTIATIQRGKAPPVNVDGKGIGVQVGNYLWERPFGVAVPEESSKIKNLCQFPSGITNWDFLWACSPP